MATGANRVPTTGGGLDSVTALLNLFGQNQKQSVSSETGPLKDLINKLANPGDPNAQLEGLFQAAAGQIPKFQAAYGNAVGARSGGNSATQAALNELLKQTTLAGQKQIEEQNLQRQQIQGQAAGNLANATRSVSQSTNPNYGNAAKVLGGMQLLGQFGITDKLKKSVIGAGADSATGAVPNLSSFTLSPDVGSNVFANSLASPESFSQGYAGSGFDWGNLTSSFASDFGNTAVTSAGTNAATTAATEGGGNILSDAWDTVSNAGSSVLDWFGFADGGLVGRDEKPIDDEDKARKEAMARANAKRTQPSSGGIGGDDRYKTSSAAPAASSPEKDKRTGFFHVERALKAIGYADGGLVKSGGGRRSSAPSYTPDTIATSVADNAVSASVDGTVPTRTGTTPNRSGGGGRTSGDREDSIFQSAPFDMGSIPVGSSTSTPSKGGTSELGPAVVGTGVPDWAIPIVGTMLGLNPLLGTALKYGNQYLRYIDPNNISSPNRINEMDKASDAAAANPPNQNPGGSGVIQGPPTQEQQDQLAEDTFSGMYDDIFSEETGPGTVGPEYGGDSFGDTGGTFPGGEPGTGDVGCVHVDSALPDDIRAGDVAVGDILLLADSSTLERGAGLVSYSEKKTQPGYRIRAGGVTLVCSGSAPIPTRMNGLVTPPHLYGEQVAVMVNEHAEWLPVTSVEFLGPIEVQHITVGDKCFWAGEKDGEYILHHNVKLPTGFATGGEVQGPGTETSDSVPIMASKGEYVVSADVVDAVGADFFDMLQSKFHTLTQQPASNRKNPPNPSVK